MGLDRNGPLPGRPLPVIEEPRSPGAGATVGVDGPGMNGRDESSGPNVATTSAGPTECRGGDAHANGRRQTRGQGDTICFSRFC